MSIFLKKELEGTKALANVKIKEILEKDDEHFSADDLRNLQTLVQLKDAAEKKISADGDS
jgi:hypothetical protein